MVHFYEILNLKCETITMKLLDGKKISNDIKNEITAEVNKMKLNGEKFLT